MERNCILNQSLNQSLKSHSLFDGMETEAFASELLKHRTVVLATKIDKCRPLKRSHLERVDHSPTLVGTSAGSVPSATDLTSSSSTLFSVRK